MRRSDVRSALDAEIREFANSPCIQRVAYFACSKIVVATPTSQCEDIGHVSPEATAGGVVGLVDEGDIIEICVQRIHLAVSDTMLKKRRTARKLLVWRPPARTAAKGVRRASDGCRDGEQRGIRCCQKTA